MRLTDLELYRWKFHHDIYIHTTNKYRPGNSSFGPMNWVQYWKEFGAFVSVLPRQSGKTEMLLTLIHHFDDEEEDYRVIYPLDNMGTMLRQRGVNKYKMIPAKTVTNKTCHMLLGIQHEVINLFVDEFDYIDKKNHLCHILDYPWKSVTMVSSLK